MSKVTSRELAIDWNDLEQVKELADKLGPGMAVIKYPTRQNYNITHASRKDWTSMGEVVYST